MSKDWARWRAVLLPFARSDPLRLIKGGGKGGETPSAYFFCSSFKGLLLGRKEGEGWEATASTWAVGPGEQDVRGGREKEGGGGKKGEGWGKNLRQNVSSCCTLRKYSALCPPLRERGGGKGSCKFSENE